MKQYYLITKINMNRQVGLGFENKEFEKEYFLNIADMKYGDLMSLKETIEKMQDNNYGTFDVEFEEIATDDIELYKVEREPAQNYRNSLMETVNSSSVLIVKIANAIKDFYKDDNELSL